MEKIKTTITVNRDLWNKFTIKVIKLHGGRKCNETIEKLIRKYLGEQV